MKTLLKRLHRFWAAHGLNPLALATLRHTPRYFGDMLRYMRHPRADEAFKLEWRCLYPILGDREDAAGVTRSHYFIQDLYMARRVLARPPQRHVDVGSRIDGFVGHLLAAGVQVEVVDIRPLDACPQGLSFVQDDATTLASLADGSVASLSSLHVTEHFGLGRYGDPIEPRAWRDFLASMARVLEVGGRLYFSTPMGRQRVEFNAHRVFSPALILEEFARLGLQVVEQAVITTGGDLVAPADPRDYAGEEYGCILLVLTKPAVKRKPVAKSR